MMLLDTHVFLWYVLADPGLSESALCKIQTSDRVFVSIASFWEMAIKSSLGKLKLPVSVPELGIDIIIVFDIVFVVAGSFRYRHEPDSVETHVLYVIELCRDSVEVSDSVVVRIEVGPYVYFVVVADFVIQGLGL